MSEEKKEYLELKNFVFCDDCGVIIKKRMAQEVARKGHDGGYPDHYCSVHKKPYDIIETRFVYSKDGLSRILKYKYYKTIPSDEIEVSVSGRKK